MPTYFEQREKIIQAYFRDEIKPYDAQFCFCGTLAWNPSRQIFSDMWEYSNYSRDELVEMERALLGTIYNSVDIKNKNLFMMTTEVAESKDLRDQLYALPQFEDILFAAMCAALDVLKEIHRSRNENVDDEPITPFVKRKLEKQNQ